jgi:hypothetical protein
VREANGHLLAQGILTRDAMMVIGQELETMAEAEAAIELAEAVKGAALLDALIYAAEVEEEIDAELEAEYEEGRAEIQAELDAEMEAELEAAEEPTPEDEALLNMAMTAVAAETLRTLILAGLIDDNEVTPALDALLSVGLLDAEILESAFAAAEERTMQVQEVASAQATR